MDHVTERTGPRQRVPLFDAPALRDFLGSPARRFFLAELLGSFTRVASGRYRVRGGGRMRTRRFSELDPVRLAGLLDGVPDAERPGVYRRLGDVCLFLSGVFPDYATLYGVGPAQVARLLRAARVPAAQHDSWPPSPPSTCWNSSARGGTGPPAGWPRCAPRGWTWSPRWRAASGRPAGCSITSRTGTCSAPTIRGSPHPHPNHPLYERQYQAGPSPGRPGSVPRWARGSCRRRPDRRVALGHAGRAGRCAGRPGRPGPGPAVQGRRPSAAAHAVGAALRAARRGRHRGY